MDLRSDVTFDENGNYNVSKYGSLFTDPKWKKTSRFGLYYDLNHVTDEVDEFGFPIVEDSFQFTSEEVLIKIFGLKKALEKYFLPHHARIIDITAEGFYFVKFNLNTWQDQNKIIPLIFDQNPDFVGNPLSGYLKHLDKLLTLYRIHQGIDVQKLSQNDKLSDLVNRNLYEFERGTNSNFEFQDSLTFEKILSYYNDYYDIKKVIFNHLFNSYCKDELNIDYTLEEYNQNKLLGQPVELKLKPKKITWDDLIGVTWNDLSQPAPNCLIRGPKQDLIDVDIYRMENHLCIHGIV